MKSVDIVLIVDHKWRDLPGLAVLAFWLEEGFGLRVRLRPYTLWERSLVIDKPQIIVLSTLTGSRSRAIVRTAHEMGTRVVVIMTEGRPNNMQGMEYLVGRQECVQGADLWFAWSETVRDYMVSRGVLPPEKIVVAGSHRFDVYAEPLRQIIKPRKDFLMKYGLDAAKPVVSWATNFTHAKFHKNNEAFLLKDWTDLGLIKFPAYAEPQEIARLDREFRERSFGLMQNMLSALPDVQLMVKPHPAEEHEPYQGFVADCRKKFGNRVAFIGHEYIWDVLHAADVHVHRLCTTGVEAWLLNVPSVELHLHDYYLWSSKLPGAASEAMAGNDCVADAAGLIERIRFYLSGGKPTPEQLLARQRYIRRWLYTIDGKRCLHHAGVFADMLQKRARIRRPRISSELLAGFLKSYLKAFSVSNNGQGKVVDKLGQVDRMMTHDDVKRMYERMKPILGGVVSQSVNTGRQAR